ncbi:MAG: DUF58 domain-containing protein [Elusimicrobia bacterium]|nr:DUF58 domain-containing protein [Elusimicrobiota bacterium]
MTPKLWRALARLGRLLDLVRLRFTPAGQLILVCLAVSAALGVDTERGMAYQSFTFLLALISLSMLCSVFFRARFEAGWRLPRFGTAGQPLPCSITLRNTGNRLQRGLSAAPELEDGEAVPERALPDLSAGAACEVEAGLLPRRRGKLRLKGVRVAKPDPFGLFRAFRRERAEASVLVLPRRYPVPGLSLPGTRRYQHGGVAAASSVGESGEFVSMRDYRPGDPLRKIHWRSWAKAGRPIVKEYQDEYFVRHALALDTFGPEGPVFEEAVSVAASFAAGLTTQDSLLDLLFVGSRTYCFTAGRGLGSPDSLLEVLACVEPCRDKTFEELQHAIIRRSASISGCVCILLGFDEERSGFIRQLRAIGVPTLALVVVGPDAPAFEEGNGILRIEVGRAAEGLAKIP